MMNFRTLLLILSSLVWGLSSSDAQTSNLCNVVYSYQDAFQNVYSNITVQVQPLFRWTPLGTNTVTGRPGVFVSTNGSVTVSNMLTGYGYRSQLIDNNTGNPLVTFTNCIGTNYNGQTVTAAQTIGIFTNQIPFLSAGQNITLTWVGNALYISDTNSGGGGGGGTNVVGIANQDGNLNITIGTNINLANNITLQGDIQSTLGGFNSIDPNYRLLFNFTGQPVVNWVGQSLVNNWTVGGFTSTNGYSDKYGTYPVSTNTATVQQIGTLGTAATNAAAAAQAASDPLGSAASATNTLAAPALVGPASSGILSNAVFNIGSAGSLSTLGFSGLVLSNTADGKQVIISNGWVLANSGYNGNLNTIPSPVALVTSNEAAQIAALTAPLASLWPEVVLSNDVSHTFTIAGVKYTAPSSVSAGLNEIAAMFPVNTNRAASGYKVRLMAGEYDIQGAIWATNNIWIEGAGGLATIIRYTGTTNGWTQQAVQTACSNTVTYCGLLNVYGNPASFPGGTVEQAPNVVLKGFTILPATNMWCADIYVNAFNCVADDVWVGGPQLGAGPDYYTGYAELNTITNASKVVGIITFGSTHMRFNDCYCVAVADGIYHTGNTYNYDDGIQGFFVGNWSNAGSQTWGNAYASNTELSLGFLVGTSQAGNIYYSSVRRLMPYKCRVDVYNGTAAVMSIFDFVDQYGEYPIGCFAFPPFIHAQSQIENLTSYAPYAVTNDTSGNWNIDSTRLVKLAVPSMSSQGGDRIFSSGNVPYIELWDTNSYSNNGAGSNAVIIQGGLPLVANGVGLTNLPAANLTGTISTNQFPLAVVLTNGAVSGQITVFTNGAWTWMTPAAGGGGGAGYGWVATNAGTAWGPTINPITTTALIVYGTNFFNGNVNVTNGVFAGTLGTPEAHMSLTVNGSQTNSQDLLVGNNLGVGGTITGSGSGLTLLPSASLTGTLPTGVWPTNVISLAAAAGTNALSITGNNVNYLQFNLQNANNAGASDYVLTEDTGTPLTGYLDVYQNNSAYSASSMKTIDSSNDVGIININTNTASRLWIQSNVTNGTVIVATTGTGGAWNTNATFYPGSGNGTGSNVFTGTLFGNLGGGTNLPADNLTGTISTNQFPLAVVLTNGAISGQIPVFTNGAWTWMTPAAGGGGGGNLSSNGPAFFSSVAVNGVAGTNTLTGTNLVFSVSGTTNVYVCGNTGYTNTVYGPAGTNTFIVATNGYFAWFSNSTPIFTFTPGTIGITNNANVDIQGTVNMVGAVTARNTFASIGAAAMYGGINMESTSIGGVSTLTVYGNASVANVTTLGTHTPAQVTVGGSPFTFANLTPANLECYVSDAAAYSLTKNGASIIGSLASDSYIMLQTNCVLVLTYSSTAPTLYTNAW